MNYKTIFIARGILYNIMSNEFKKPLRFKRLLLINPILQAFISYILIGSMLLTRGYTI
jgi:hypothetical protein